MSQSKSASPWFVDAVTADQKAKRFAPATLRNRDAIVDALRGVLPERGAVLEIASGTGEHIVHFAAAFSALSWIPSDVDPEARASVAAWCAEAALQNVLPPLAIDANDEWFETLSQRVDAIVCINMVHISPWSATLGLLRGAARCLPEGSPLYLYGPFLRLGVPTAESNLDFDRSLRERDESWGIRSLEDVAEAAAAAGFVLDSVIEMPANNLSVVFRRS
jgi:hypothetical protein